jgi:hypothetical protein
MEEQREQQREDGPLEAQIPAAAQRRTQQRRAVMREAAKALDGRLISKKFKNPATGRPRAYQGQLSYRGDETTGHPFLVTYEDNDTELMSLAAAQKLLLPEGTAVVPRAAGQQVSAAVAPAAVASTWQLNNVEGVRAALMSVMPW